MVQKRTRKNRGVSATHPETPKKRWQFETAKARFSEVFRRARSEGPQWVIRHDKEAVVILPAEEFERLTARSRQPKSLVQFFRESPLVGLALDLERDKDTGREIELCVQHVRKWRRSADGSPNSSRSIGARKRS